MNTVKTDNKIINTYIFYVILLVIPIVIQELYEILSAYYITVLLFGIMLLKYYDFYISAKKIMLVLGFILLQYLALATSGNELSIEDFALPIMYGINMVSLFVFTENIRIDEKGLAKFYKFYLYFSIIFCIYNFIYNYSVIMNLLNMSGSLEGLMIASAFRNRNTFGFVLIWAVISGIYLYYTTRQKKYLFYLLFIVCNIIITFSRNSIITTFIFLLVFSWFFFKENRKKILYSLLALAGVVSLIMSNSRINSLVMNALVRADSGLSKREIAWRFFFDNMDLRDYIIGSGVGSTQVILEPIHFYSYHNGFLDLVGTGGLISLVIYFIAIVYLTKYYYRVYTKYPLEGSIFLASIVAFQFYFMFESVVLQIGIGFLDVLVALFIYVLPLLYIKSLALKKGDLEIEKNNQPL